MSERGEGSASDEPHGGSGQSEAEASPDHCTGSSRSPITSGSAYLRYSFTKGTVQEVDFVVDALGLKPGDRVLDVGCGPGRHAHELARRGLVVHGIDISQRFIELADARSAVRGDVRTPRCPLAAVPRGVRRRDLPVPGGIRADDANGENVRPRRASPEP